MGYHSRFNPECNTERDFIDSLSIALGGGLTKTCWTLLFNVQVLRGIVVVQKFKYDFTRVLGPVYIAVATTAQCRAQLML